MTTPLWRMMHDAYLKPKLSGPEGHLGFAAEIRAIAGEMSDVFDLTGDAGRVFEWLLAEADRAEAGEAASPVAVQDRWEDYVESIVVIRGSSTEAGE